MQEIILKKISVFKTKINAHLLQTVDTYLQNNKQNFKERTWNCNIKTSNNISKNILHEVDEFSYVRKNIEEHIEKLLKNNFKKSIPFMITQSWINILGENGYQEFHTHGSSFGSGVLYLTDQNSKIEFSLFPEDTRKDIVPEKNDLLLFDSNTFHRVLESDKERISLAFNFNTYGI
tara:strand:+ start:126 stop:653 length:528 start_codon:yes stop_codon:yes gene_type:complete